MVVRLPSRLHCLASSVPAFAAITRGAPAIVSVSECDYSCAEHRPSTTSSTLMEHHGWRSPKLVRSINRQASPNVEAHISRLQLSATLTSSTGARSLVFASTREREHGRLPSSWSR